MTDPLTRARELARVQSTDRAIAETLVVDCAISLESAHQIVSLHRGELSCCRSKGTTEVLELAYAIARGEIKASATQMRALDLLGHAYAGWGIRLEDVVARVRKEVVSSAHNSVRNLTVVSK